MQSQKTSNAVKYASSNALIIINPSPQTTQV